MCMDEIESGIEQNKAFIRNRITELRLKANVSEYQMSFDLGKSRGYIQEISAGKSMPSMAGFLNICDYFNITPAEFFDYDLKAPVVLNDIIKKLRKLPEEDLIFFGEVLSRLSHD